MGADAGGWGLGADGAGCGLRRSASERCGSALLAAALFHLACPAHTASPLVPPTRPCAEASFAAGLGMAGADLLREGLERLVEDANRLEPFFLNLAGGQE